MKKYFLILFSLSFTVVKAQQIPFFNQYYFNTFIYNPAMAGIENRTNIFLMHRQQWRGIEGAPGLNLLSADAPLKFNKIGIGATVFRETKGLAEKTSAQAAYSYRANFSEDNSISFGISAGIINNRINVGQAVVNDTDDPFLTGSPGKTGLDANAGIAYKFKKAEIGLAVPQLLASTLTYSAGEKEVAYNLKRHYLASLKYSFDVNEEKGVSISPLVLTRIAPGAPVQYDVNIILDWKNTGWLAAAYKSDYALAVNAGIKFKNIHVGYAYDIVTGSIGAYSGASHEILLGYSFGVTPKEKPVKIKKQVEEEEEPEPTSEEIEKLKAEIKERERTLKEHETYILKLIDTFYTDTPEGKVTGKQEEINKIRRELEQYKADMNDYINKLKLQIEEEKKKLK